MQTRLVEMGMHSDREINSIPCMPAGNAVIAVGQVTYHRQPEGGASGQSIVVWVDLRHRGDGEWVHVFRPVHWPLETNSQPQRQPPTL